MSIETILKELIEDGRLIEVRSILGGSRQRLVYAPPDVLDDLNPVTASDTDTENAAQLRAWLDGFTKGRPITVGSDKNPNVDIKILDPRSDEVWELRKRDQPSTRIFGRFAMKDVFVATNICTSRDLFRSKWVTKSEIRWPVWREEIKRCKAVWRALFVDYKPVSGDSLDDYLSNASDDRN